MDDLLPILSIIIPVYNVEKYIGETLDSCLTQDISPEKYEIICIDDGSADQSRLIIQEYQEKNTNIVLFSQENAGVSSARNRGLELAKGKYVWFIDGDDLIAPDCLGEQIREMETSNADKLRFKVLPFRGKVPVVPFTGNYEICKERDRVYDFMYSRGGGGVWVNIYTSRILKENNILFCEQIKYSEDVLFDFNVLLKSKICAKNNSVFYFYRQREGSATHVCNHTEHIKSMSLLAQAYNVLYIAEPDDRWKQIIESKRNYAIRALQFSAMRHGNVSMARSILEQLKIDGFYPYPFLRESLTGNETWKQALINWISFGFSMEWYFLLCVRIAALIKRIKQV